MSSSQPCNQSPSNTIDLTQEDHENQTIDLTTESPNNPTQPSTSPIPVPSSPFQVESEEDEDEDLRAALALSLLPPSPPQQQTSPLMLAATTSSTFVTNPPTMAKAMKPPTALLSSKSPTSVSVTQLPSRAQMEQERLARLSLKRKRDANGDVSPPPLTRPAKIGFTSTSISRSVSTAIVSSTSAPKSKLPSSSTPQGNSTPTSSSASNGSQSSPPSSSKLTYPTPTILKTHSIAHPDIPGDPTVKISDLLDRSNLQSCLLSAFTWDMDWLFPKLDTKRTAFLLVMHAKSPEHRALLTSDFAGIPNVRLCFPPMTGSINCMHSKLMLLFFPDYLRIVIPTANLVPYDWGEDGRMENTVFVVDLPKLTDNINDTTPSAKSESQTVFQTSLNDFLKAQTVSRDVISKLTSFNFTSTHPIRFIHSIGGSHPSTAATHHQTGHPGLATSIASLGLRTTQPIQLDYITSSLGALTTSYLYTLYLAAQGNPATPTARRNPFTLATQGTIPITTPSNPLKNFNVYFPSHETITCSTGSRDAAGTICFQERWWHNPTFPRQNVRDCVSTRDGLLMHNKILYARFQNPITTPTQSFAGWAYVGSANLSESAWGRLSAATSKQTLTCKNWECGVIIPIPIPIPFTNSDKKGASSSSSASTDNLAQFSGKIPIPMHYPGAPFDDRQPWFFNRH